MLAHRITMLRRNASMSQSQLAESLNISASTVGMYEQGRRAPGLDILIRMSKVFDVSLDFLITGADFTPSKSDSNALHSVEKCPCHTCYWKEYKLRYLK